MLCLFHYYRLAVFRRRKTGIFLEKQAEILRTHVAAACDIGNLTFLVPVIGYDAYALYNAVVAPTIGADNGQIDYLVYKLVGNGRHFEVAAALGVQLYQPFIIAVPRRGVML